ncbi:MAG: hypothetical protein AAGF36_07565 [Pseudomonadota bacterium]
MTEHPPLYIHAGAHRTGSTSFQWCLHENRLVLEAQGWTLAYPGRDGIPTGQLALRLPAGRRIDPAAAARKARRALGSYKTGRPVILSEENILGRMFHFMKGQFYPFAENRCAALRAAWDGPIRHLLLVVRPYEDLFVSAFRKRAEDHPMPEFSALRDRYLNIDRGWPELAAAMCDILEPEQMTVLPYAARGTNLHLLHRLAPGLDGSGLIEPNRVANQSPSDAALAHLQTRHRAEVKLSRADIHDIALRYATDQTRGRFAGFSELDRADLAARYASDLKQIEWMSNINVA